MKRLAAILFCVLCFAGCSSPMPSTPEELLDAPKLSEEQYQVDKALRDQLGQDIKLKYPQSGSYRSAFTFHDIDKDGQEEAIVLHSLPSGGNAQITVMDQRDGEWLVDKTFPGLSPDVDFIRFDSLGDGQVETIVIGWRPEGGQKIVAVYRYRDREFTMLGSEDYTQLAIGDFNGDGFGEMLLVSAENNGRSVLLYMGEQDGRLEALDGVSLPRDIVSFQPPVFGQIAPGVVGVALDALTEQGELCTILVQVVDELLVLPLSDGEEDLLSQQTVRPGGEQGVYSQDVNGDGVIDIPTQWAPPGSDQLDQDSRLAFTSYVNLGPGGFSTVLRAFVEPNAGYRLEMPDRWFTGSESVTASRQAGSAEITFFLYDGADAANRSRELLRLQVVDLQAPPRQFDAESYFLLGRRGGFEYYASLPGGRGEEGYSLTQEEVADLFRLI